MFKALAGAAAVGLAGTGFALTRPISKMVGTEPYEAPGATSRQLEAVTGLTVFFGHQSVGGNVVAALPQVFAAAGVDAPEIVRVEDGSTISGPAFLHTNIGRNRDPLGKLAAFDRAIRGGLGDAVDVAAVKLCYADIVEGSDVERIFAAHRDTLTTLQRDFPNVAFISATVPVTVEPQGVASVAKTRLMRVLNRPSTVHPANNVVRERYNAMLRTQYGETGHLLDIAALQSAAAGGGQQLRRYRGDTLFAMEPSHATDPGHLNPGGAMIVGRAFMALIADSAA